MLLLLLLQNTDSLMNWVIRSVEKIMTNQMFSCPGRRAFNSDKSTYGNSNLPVWWYSFDASPSNSVCHDLFHFGKGKLLGFIFQPVL